MSLASRSAPSTIHVDDPLTIGEVELRETLVGDHSGRVRSGTHF